MLKLSFNQTRSELMVRAAATILFNSLTRNRTNEVKVAELTEHPQYGFTARATAEPIGPKFVRITDLQDGKIEWNNVPFCECLEPAKYLLRDNDILFARTGATTGKTHLVRNPEPSVFASYLIRLRPKSNVEAGYLHAFFQSENYWSQIAEEKEGSAQPNVNGDKLIRLKIPLVEPGLQRAIADFLTCVRQRQDGESVQLPELPRPLAKQRRIVARIEELAAKINEARGLRQKALGEVEALVGFSVSSLCRSSTWKTMTVSELVGNDSLRNGKSVKSSGDIGEVRCLTLSAMRNGRIDIQDNKVVPLTPDEAEPFLIRKGDVFIVRGNGSKNLCGMAGLVTEESDSVIFPDLFIRVPLPKQYILPEFFVAAWNSAATRQVIEEKAKTTSGIWKVNQGHITSTEIPVPPLPEQRGIVSELDALRAQVNALQKLQAETAAELDALLPSILDKAFRGEL